MNCKGHNHRGNTQICDQQLRELTSQNKKIRLLRNRKQMGRGHDSVYLECDGIHHHYDRTLRNRKQRKAVGKHNTTFTIAVKRATRSNAEGLGQAESQKPYIRL